MVEYCIHIYIIMSYNAITCPTVSMPGPSLYWVDRRQNSLDLLPAYSLMSVFHQDRTLVWPWEMSHLSSCGQPSRICQRARTVRVSPFLHFSNVSTVAAACTDLPLAPIKRTLSNCPVTVRG